MHYQASVVLYLLPTVINVTDEKQENVDDQRRDQRDGRRDDQRDDQSRKLDSNVDFFLLIKADSNVTRWLPAAVKPRRKSERRRRTSEARW